LVRLHIYRALEGATVFQDNARRTDVAHDLARGADHDLFATKKLAFDLSVDPYDPGVDVCGYSPVFTDHKVIVFEVHRSFDRAVYDEVFLTSDIAMDDD
jgi:hypothetical protein